MKLLAIDTSTEACSAALYLDGETSSRYELAPRRHAELILPMVDSLLAGAGMQLIDLDAIAFGRGPGSFTGLRIATGIAQGLAFAANLPLVPVSTLAALAWTKKDKAGYIAAAVDARMNEIYFGLYQTGDAIELIGEERVLAPDKITVPATVTTCFGAGSGWARYSDSLSGTFSNRLTGYDGECYPHAAAIAVLAVPAVLDGETIKPGDAMPVYLRDKVADAG